MKRKKKEKTRGPFSLERYYQPGLTGAAGWHRWQYPLVPACNTARD
jgi:hypothetical protein